MTYDMVIELGRLWQWKACFHVIYGPKPSRKSMNSSYFSAYGCNIIVIPFYLGVLRGLRGGKSCITSTHTKGPPSACTVVLSSSLECVLWISLEYTKPRHSMGLP